MLRRAGSKRVWRVFPHELVSVCDGSEKGSFIDLVSGRLLLLIRLDDLQGELAQGLQSIATAGDDSIEPMLEALPYETRSRSMHASPPISRYRRKEDFNYITLRFALDKDAYHVCPLRKRPIEGKPFEQRISIGRARNNDIVLRHTSVSKFHAWFELSDRGDVLLGDASSSNGTLLNGEPVRRDMLPVSEGDRIEFGSVSTQLCSPATLWEAFH